MQISGHWVHDIDPFFIEFPESWPISGIYWYGIAYLLSFLCGAGWLYYAARKHRSVLPIQGISSFIFYLILGIILGGRIGYMVLYGFSDWIEHPLEVFYLWHGGMASHGGFIGAFLAILYFAKKHHSDVWALTDLICSIAPLGLLLGRLANFINGEVYGRITTCSWGIIFPQSAPYTGFPLELLLPRHPSQLYEAFLEGILLLILMQFLFWKYAPRFSDSSLESKNSSSKELYSGMLTAIFLVVYGILRIFVEYFREPDASLIFGWTRGQFYSLFIVGVGIGLSIWSGMRKKIIVSKKNNL